MGSLCSSSPSDQESEVVFLFSIRIPVSLKPKGFPKLADGNDSENDSDNESVTFLQLPPSSQASSKKCSPRVSSDRWTTKTLDQTPPMPCSDRISEN